MFIPLIRRFVNVVAVLMINHRKISLNDYTKYFIDPIICR